MSAGLVLDELDINFSSFTPWLVIIVVVVVGSCADPRTLYTAIVGAISVAGRVVLGGGRMLCIRIRNVGHSE